ncbi:MAG: beta-lactamase family protein [Rhodoferax sp.]|nr:beta-lactamase family protein [Rhodoferax sp.]
MASHNFKDFHAAMQSQVDQQFLPGVSTALLQGRDVVDTFCCGFADREAAIPLAEDHIFRMFSNTKLVTSCAVLMLFEAGQIQWDDPIEAYIPELGARQVLRPGAMRIDDVEPAKTSITIRHLMTHTSGLSYGIFDPGTPMFDAYNRAVVMNPGKTLGEMMTTLAGLPLAFQPGTQWEYSVATDVLGRLVEVVSGESFGAFLQRRIFEPLNMTDTDFWVPEAKMKRLCALYVGASLLDPTKPGLFRADDKPYPAAYTRKLPRESGGGGLVSTLGDTVRFIQSFLPGGPALLQPDTIALMYQNQLPANLCVQFPNMPRFTSKGFGLGSAVAIGTNALEPIEVLGEVGWGGLAGTIWWINPRIGIAGVLMTQRFFGFGNPYSYVFKRQAYKALGFS